MKISIDEQITEVRREINTRKRLYPQWLAQANRNYSKATLDTQLARMEAALESLLEVKKMVDSTLPHQHGLELEFDGVPF